MTTTGTKAPPRRKKEPTEKAPARPRAAIDPRIRARRAEVQRTEGRKRLRRMGIVGSVAAGLVAAWWLTLTPLLDVDAIHVEGATHTGDEAVLAALGIGKGDALLTADVGAAAEHLTALPWVATADVRRSWPGTVRVTVVERTPIAVIAAQGGGWVVVDVAGHELALEKEPAVELIRVAGLPVEPSLGSTIDDAYRGSIDLAAGVPTLLHPALTALWPQEDGTIEATAKLPSGRAVVHFGVPDQLEAKLLAFGALLERADLTGVTIIDLRVPGAPALTRG